MSIKIKLKPRRLLIVLAKRNISQNTFAREGGITSGHFSQMLTGGRCPGPVYRQRIMDSSGLTWDELFEVVEPAKAAPEATI